MNEITEIWLTGKAIAQQLGLDERTIQLSASKGNITKDGRDRYGLLSAYQWRIAQLSKTSDVKLDLIRAQTEKLLIETKLKQVEYDRTIGNLIPLEEAQEEVRGVFLKIKSKLEGMPSRVALEVSGTDDPREVDRLIGSIVYECLTELSLSFMEEAVESIG